MATIRIHSTRTGIVVFALIGMIVATVMFLFLTMQSEGFADRGDPDRELASNEPPLPGAAQKPAVAAEDQFLRSIAPQAFPLGDYAELLNEYMVDGRVDGARLSAEGRERLDGLTLVIQRTNPKMLSQLNAHERMAWYINAYNILALKTIAQNQPTESIHQRPETWSTLHPVAFGELSLNQIKDDVLRARNESIEVHRSTVDPRVHFAIGWVSAGCASLNPRPFTAGNLEELLDEGVRTFLSSPANFRFEGGTLHLSRMLDRCGEDFELLYDDATLAAIPQEKKIAAVGLFVSKYVDDPTVAESLRTGKYELQWLDCDSPPKSR